MPDPNRRNLMAMTLASAAVVAAGGGVAQAQSAQTMEHDDFLDSILATLPSAKKAATGTVFVQPDLKAIAASPDQPGGSGDPHSLSNFTTAETQPDDKDPKRQMVFTTVYTCVPGSTTGVVNGHNAGEKHPMIVQMTNTRDNGNHFDNKPQSRWTAYFDLNNGNVTLYGYTNQLKEVRANAQYFRTANGPQIRLNSITVDQQEYHLNATQEAFSNPRFVDFVNSVDSIAKKAYVIALNGGKYGYMRPIDPQHPERVIPGTKPLPDDFKSAIVNPLDRSVEMQMGEWRFKIDSYQHLTGVNTRTGTVVSASSPRSFYDINVHIGFGRDSMDRYTSLGNVTVAKDGYTQTYNFRPDGRTTYQTGPGFSETSRQEGLPPDLKATLETILEATKYAQPYSGSHWFDPWFPQIPGGSKPAAGQPGSPDNLAPTYKVGVMSTPKGQKAASSPVSDKPTSVSGEAGADIPKPYGGGGSSITQTPLAPLPQSGPPAWQSSPSRGPG